MFTQKIDLFEWTCDTDFPISYLFSMHWNFPGGIFNTWGRQGETVAIDQCTFFLKFFIHKWIFKIYRNFLRIPRHHCNVILYSGLSENETVLKGCKWTNQEWVFLTLIFVHRLYWTQYFIMRLWHILEFSGIP